MTRGENGLGPPKNNDHSEEKMKKNASSSKTIIFKILAKFSEFSEGGTMHDLNAKINMQVNKGSIIPKQEFSEQ